ncbi:MULTISPECIES: amidase [Actinoalloteichus]|uniref:amidase n=1 Tax=Actinoalloteichus TaxID=65496 RepID=UPI000953560E|nr:MULTISPECIES: amidase [Actinoalloteichus]
MVGEDLAESTAGQLRAAFDRGETTPREAAEAVLARIDRLDGQVNAFCLLDEATTLAAADAATDRLRRGVPLGPLDGIPVSIKDVLLTKGWPTMRGSRSTDVSQPWDADGPSVARLREQGAVFVGKTTTPELAWKGVTDGPLTGVTRNPWDPGRTAGGSSGGGAAAVALGMAPLTLGTDGGGSVRIPGSFCGIFALKPTYGLISHYPSSPFGTLAHVGPMTRTVADAALLLDAVAVPDPRDWSALPAPTTPFVETLGAGVRGLRIAFSPDLGYVEVDQEVAEQVAAAVEVFAELGAVVEQVDPGFTDPVTEFHTLWFAGAAKSLEALSDRQRARLDPGLREIAEQGAEYSALDYLTANACRAALGALMGRFHQRYDLLLTPTMPIPAFEAGRESPAGSSGPRWTSWTQFTYPFNMTQQPAATVPCGFTRDGLPIGLQVVGPRHADAAVLAACHAFETARPWQGRRPVVAGG